MLDSMEKHIGCWKRATLNKSAPTMLYIIYVYWLCHQKQRHMNEQYSDEHTFDWQPSQSSHPNHPLSAYFWLGHEGMSGGRSPDFLQSIHSHEFFSPSPRAYARASLNGRKRCPNTYSSQTMCHHFLRSPSRYVHQDTVTKSWWHLEQKHLSSKTKSESQPAANGRQNQIISFAQLEKLQQPGLTKMRSHLCAYAKSERWNCQCVKSVRFILIIMFGVYW